MRPSQTLWVIAIVSGIVILVLASAVVLLVMQPQKSGSQAAVSTSTESSNGLSLSLMVNSTSLSIGQSLLISVSQYNRLTTTNNVSASNSWEADIFALGPCGRGIFPFGVAVLQGEYTAENLSEAKALSIYLPAACPLFTRLITGYLFQTMSDLAVVLPSSGNTSPTAMSSSVTLSGEYSGSQRLPFPPGQYTVVAGDEWGDLVFLYFSVGG